MFKDELVALILYMRILKLVNKIISLNLYSKLDVT